MSLLLEKVNSNNVGFTRDMYVVAEHSISQLALPFMIAFEQVDSTLQVCCENFQATTFHIHIHIHIPIPIAYKSQSPDTRPIDTDAGEAVDTILRNGPSLSVSTTNITTISNYIKSRSINSPE